MLRMRPLTNRSGPTAAQLRGRVLQRQIVPPGGLGGLHGQSQELTQIVNQVNRYNRVIGALTGEQRLLLMSTLRGYLYTWLVANPLHPNRDVILDLLNQVRAEHQRQTVLLQAGGNIYVRNDPQNDAQLLWTRLVNGVGSVIIEDRDYGQRIVNGANVFVAGFRDRVLSAFATLLETPEGQKLVRKLLNSPQTVRIVPLTNITRQALNQLQQGVVMGRNTQPGVGGFRIGNAPIVPPPVHGGQSPGVTFADPVPFVGMGGFNVNAYIGAVGGTKANIDMHSGAVLPQIGGGVPQGSAAIVAIEPNLDDADVFSLNANGGGPLITPLFLTLAHELLHAKRMMRGRSRIGPAPIPAFNNAEEYRAITAGNTSENSLRAVYGIGTRFGHGGALRAQLPPPLGNQLVLYQPPMVGGGQLVPYVPPQQAPQQMALVPYQAPGGSQLVPYVPPQQAPQQMALVPYQAPGGGQLVPYVPPQQAPQQMALVPYQAPGGGQLVPYVPPPRTPRQMALVPYRPQQNLALVPYRQPAPQRLAIMLAPQRLAIMPPPQLPMIGWH